MFVLFFLTILLQNIDTAPHLPNTFFVAEHGLQHVKSDDYSIHKISRRSPPITLNSESTYQSSNGLTCYVCQPGFKWTSDCSTNGTTAVCERCPDGQYNSLPNIAIRCAACSTYCVDRNAEVYNVCNSTSDMTCRCKDRYYNHSKGGGEFICIPHSKCSPGQELYQVGTPYTDTQCRPCQPGTFSHIKSLETCKPCTTCSSDQLIMTACAGTTDTVCKYKGNNLALKIVLPLVVCVFLAVIVLGLLWRKGKLAELKAHFQRACSKTTDNPVIFEYVEPETAVKTLVCTGEKTETGDKAPWRKVFMMLIQETSFSELRSVVRTLLAKRIGDIRSENTIEKIFYEYHHEKPDERMYQCFHKWLTLCDEAFLDDVIDALVEDNMLGMANELQNEFPSLLRNNRCGTVTENENNYQELTT